MDQRRVYLVYTYMKQSYFKELIIFIVIGALIAGIAFIVFRFYQKADQQIQQYLPIIEQALREAAEEEATPSSEPVSTSSSTPQTSVTPTPRVTNRPRATTTAIQPVQTCNGVVYNDTCLSHTCIDLDAPNQAGFGGDQYAIKSRIFWVEQSSNTQYYNEDYCDANGQLVEYACEILTNGQRRPYAISVTDSVCKDGKAGF